MLHRRPWPRRAAARLLGVPRRRHGRGRGAARSPAVGSGFSSRRTTYGEVVPSKPPDDSRQPDELQELLTLLGAAAQLAGCWLYVEDRFTDGTVRSAYDAPGFGALFGDPDLEEIIWRDHVLAEDEEILHGLATVVPGDRVRRALPAARRRRRGARGARPRPRPPDGGRRGARVGDGAGHHRRAGDPRDGAPASARRSTSTTSPTSCAPTAPTSPSSRPARSTACSGGIPEGMTYGEAWHAAVHPDDRALAGSLMRPPPRPASRSTSSTAWSASTASRAGSGCAARCARRSPTARASWTASRRT